MSNIINVKEERNVLSFDGDVFDIVANSTNFYLKFTLSEDWVNCPLITVVFNLDGEKYFVELDSDKTCQIPATNASKILFSITAEPDKDSKLSSTILSLNVEPSGCSCMDGVAVYENAHRDLLGLIGNLEKGIGVSAEYARIAETSQTQVSLTGDEIISGIKDFSDRILYQSSAIPSFTEVSNLNHLMNSSFAVYQNPKGGTTITRDSEDTLASDRWVLSNGNGSFHKNYHTLECTDLDGNPIIMSQWIENGGDYVIGKTITLSATIDGVRYSGTETIPATLTEDVYFNVVMTENFAFRLYIKKSTKKTGVQFVVNPGVKITIEEVKLEQSEYATKYIKPSYAEEFAQCQRYLQKLRVNTFAVATDTMTLEFFVPTPVPLRTSTALTCKTLPTIAYNNGDAINKTFEIKVKLVQDNGVLFKLTTTELAFVVGAIYSLSNGVVYVDGGIY